MIPKDFSATMMTFFTEDAHHAVIEYYSNEKKNAVAPNLTGARRRGGRAPGDGPLLCWPAPAAWWTSATKSLDEFAISDACDAVTDTSTC